MSGLKIITTMNKKLWRKNDVKILSIIRKKLTYALWSIVRLKDLAMAVNEVDSAEQLDFVVCGHGGQK